MFALLAALARHTYKVAAFTSTGAGSRLSEAASRDKVLQDHSVIEADVSSQELLSCMLSRSRRSLGKEEACGSSVMSLYEWTINHHFRTFMTDEHY